MPWSNQSPPANDVVISGIRLPLGGFSPTYIEIDRVVDGKMTVYRMTVGDLFNSRELAYHAELEPLCRLANLLSTCTSASTVQMTVAQFKRGELF